MRSFSAGLPFFRNALPVLDLDAHHALKRCERP
jgi:hypothetical protein